jgi:hypothetical protein
MSVAASLGTPRGASTPADSTTMLTKRCTLQDFSLDNMELLEHYPAGVGRPANADGSTVSRRSGQKEYEHIVKMRCPREKGTGGRSPHFRRRGRGNLLAP